MTNMEYIEDQTNKVLFLPGETFPTQRQSFCCASPHRSAARRQACLWSQSEQKFYLRKVIFNLRKADKHACDHNLNRYYLKYYLRKVIFKSRQACFWSQSEQRWIWKKIFNLRKAIGSYPAYSTLLLFTKIQYCLGRGQSLSSFFLFSVFSLSFSLLFSFHCLSHTVWMF